ncbi:MAG: histidine--tRNA ligase [Bacteroidales bacterium]|nr:histidine--tRNA ligase [Bacteroidales bacterium]
MPAKPAIPKGTRDFSPDEMQRRYYIFDTIKSVFTLFGYLPIETPAMENLSTLLGKYGEEGDRLLFRILNSGNYLEGVDRQTLADSDPAPLSAIICEKGLRYDLTVPFARYVVQHRDEITFPFRRFQIQPVWRADRPQKGRYREFYQCDADVIGSDALINEYELILIIREVFRRLGMKCLIKVNNRKILTGMAEIAGVGNRITDITVEIDKLEKTGIESVVGSLKQKGIPDESIDRLLPLIELSGTPGEKLSYLETVFATSETGRHGVAELRELFSYFTDGEYEGIDLDLALARGLNYYTGAIIEVKSLDTAIGSICGGGRYDDLAGIFGMEGVSGVGVSFGADRIYDVMLHAGLFPPFSATGTRVLIVNFGGNELSHAIKIAGLLRGKGVNTEIYPDAAKMKKQFGYADSRHIPEVLIAGADEISAGEVTLKEMSTGNQVRLSLEDLIKRYE